MKRLQLILVFTLFLFLANNSFAQDGRPTFRLAPNPADEFTELFVDSETVTPTSIRVFDLIGNQVAYFTVASNNHSHTVRIETATLKPGVYFLSVYTSSGRIETLKFLKAR